MKVEFMMVGVAPLLMHNGQLADPLGEATKALKAVTGKKKKSDLDQLLVRQRELEGSLYMNPRGPCLTSDLVEASILGGAKKHKCGTLVKASMFCNAENFDLLYEGPRSKEELVQTPAFIDVRGVKVGTARVMRSRPRFDTWSCRVQLNTDDSINEADLKLWVETAGDLVGIGDFRPRFGRFRIEDWKTC